MESLRRMIKTVLPKKLFTLLQPYYHLLLAYIGSLKYHHPSRKLVVIGVTGTKGKSSTTEILGHLLRAHGFKVATLSTIQFSIDSKTERNLFKMTMPGRFFVQNFLRSAVDAGCTHAVIEMTSEGAKQHRHRFIDIDALIFTNLTPEHIESHGSFENYKRAKLLLAQAVANSPKRPRFIVANTDDEHGADFLQYPIEHNLTYSLKDLSLHSLHKDSVSMVLAGTTLRAPLVGIFNIYNCLAAITLARAFGVSLETIQTALQNLPPLKGRVEMFKSPHTLSKQFTAVVDYAHTPDSLTKLYEAFADKPKVCVLGNTGGGRDSWKRPEMGVIAERFCDHIILTNEDPYDEDPHKIIGDMQKDLSPNTSVEVILDRRTAIKTAFQKAPNDSYVLISGKGTDPYIMGPHGTKTPWSDAAVVEEVFHELENTQAT